MTEQKIYLPGAEWLYFRIYTGYHTADNIIGRVLHPLANELIKNGCAESWFFIRYADPDHHLRYRVRLSPTGSIEDVMKELNVKLKDYVSQGLVWKVEVSTYVPEVERYGQYSMEQAEHIFYADSDAYVRFKEYASTHHDTDLPWLYAMASAGQYLNDFNLAIEDRKDLLMGLSRSFGKEFNKDKQLAKQLSAKYRIQRKRIDNLLGDVDAFSEDNNLIKILEQRSIVSGNDISDILVLYSRGMMEVPLNELIPSFIHMTMNRIFPNNNRLHEMVLYDYLFRYYKSKMARQMA